MAGDGCRAELFDERHRDALRAACAEDQDIWQIYAFNFGPGGFDESIDLYRSSKHNRTFVLFDRNERSQAAMTKLGAVREGLLRADRITWTGHVRDTVLYSILKEEWAI